MNVANKNTNQKHLSKGVLRKRSSENIQKVTGKHPCRSVISIKLLCKFIEITILDECFLVNLVHISKIHFRNNTSGELLLLSRTAPFYFVGHIAQYSIRQESLVVFKRWIGFTDNFTM